MRCSGGVGRVRFVRLPAVRAAPGIFTACAVAGALAAPSALAVANGAPATVQAPPLTGPASATLTQVNAAQWRTTVYLDTAALCAGNKPAGNKFTLVTTVPSSVTAAAAPAYPGGLACAAAAAHPVTEVTLSFTPALSAVPQSAALVVTPPQALLAAGDAPAQVMLTVRRIVSPWQYVGIPALCGGGLALLLVALLLVIGVPAIGRAPAAAALGRGVAADAAVRRAGLVIRRQLGDERHPADRAGRRGAHRLRSRRRAGARRRPRPVRPADGAGRRPHHARAAAVQRAQLAVPRQAPARAAPGPGPGPASVPAPADEVVAASLWVMLLASCITVIAVGAETGLVGWVLGYDLLVASPPIRWIPAGRGRADRGAVPRLRRALDPHPGRPAGRHRQGDREAAQLPDVTMGGGTGSTSTGTTGTGTTGTGNTGNTGTGSTGTCACFF